MYIAPKANAAIFDKPEAGLHVDIFYEKLDFCHAIYWKDRLETDSPTIPLTELLLEKMQIVQINEKDIIDTIMLLLEHPLGDIDKETINMKLSPPLCADEWGLVAHHHDEPRKSRTTGAPLPSTHRRAKSQSEIAGRRMQWPVWKLNPNHWLETACPRRRPCQMVQRCG